MLIIICLHSCLLRTIVLSGCYQVSRLGHLNENVTYVTYIYELRMTGSIVDIFDAISKIVSTLHVSPMNNLVFGVKKK